MVYDNTNSRVTTPGMIIASGTLLAANNEADDNALMAAVDKILAEIQGSSQKQIATGDFNNCLDFAHEAVRRLNTARYLSQADYQAFETVYTAKKDAVKTKTDAGTMEKCKRGSGSKECAPAAPASAPKNATPPPKKGKRTEDLD